MEMSIPFISKPDPIGAAILAKVGNNIDVQTLGKIIPATIVEFGQYDSENKLVRG